MICWFSILPADVLKSRVQIGNSLKRTYVFACVHVSNVSPEVLLALLVRKCFYLSVLPPFPC